MNTIYPILAAITCLLSPGQTAGTNNRTPPVLDAASNQLPMDYFWYRKIDPAITKHHNELRALRDKAQELMKQKRFLEAVPVFRQIDSQPEARQYIDNQQYAIALEGAGQLQEAINIYRREVYRSAPYDWMDHKGQSIRAQVTPPQELQSTLEALNSPPEEENSTKPISENAARQKARYVNNPGYNTRDGYVLAQYILLLLQTDNNAEARMVYQWMIDENEPSESWRTIFLQGAATARPKQIEAFTLLFQTWKHQGKIAWASPASKYPKLVAHFVEAAKLKPGDWKLGMEGMQFVADIVEQLYPNSLALPMTRANNIAFYGDTLQEKKKAALLYQSVLDRHGSSDALLAAKQIANKAMPDLQEDITSLQEEEEDQQAEAKTALH